MICLGEDSDSYSSYNMSYSDSHSYDTSSDSNSSDEDDDDMYWWDLLCAADDDCPWEQRLVDHQFDCNTDLFIFTTLCVQGAKMFTHVRCRFYVCVHFPPEVVC